jgi:hypothetical protein
MKKGNYVFAILFILGLFSFDSVFSQDDRLPELDAGSKEIRSENSPELSLEGEAKIIKPVVVYRDSTQQKPLLKKSDKPKTDENTSVLSFNFLYYLIERYKLADIVD